MLGKLDQNLLKLKKNFKEILRKNLGNFLNK